MKRQILYPAAAVLGGLACAAVRVLELQYGFEADTGLPVTGEPYLRILCALWLGLAVLCLAAVRLDRSVCAEPCGTWEEAFGGGSVPGATVFAAGILCWTAGGAWQLVNSVSAGTSVLAGAVWGALAIAAAGSLLSALKACRSPQPDFPAASLCVPVVYLIVVLVVAYRDGSINPTVRAYAPTLLALSALILGFFHAASFPVGDGHPRRMVFWSAVSVPLCLTALPGQSFGLLFLVLAGGALMQLGLLSLRLGAAERHAQEKNPVPADKS